MAIVREVAIGAVPGAPDLSVDPNAMARMAVEVLVGPVQGEVGLAVVVEAPDRPAVGRVAALTRGAQAPAMVVVAMAGDAGNVCFPEDGAGMALFAGRHGMESEQREACQVVVEHYPVPPPAFVVTALTAPPLLSSMHVVFFMAGEAARVRLLLVDRAAVASFAAHAPVTVPEWELRVAVVVEGDGSPALRRVALLALLSPSAPMVVVDPVAGVAVGPEFLLKQDTRVAGRTLGLAMTTGQRKLRVAVMVEDRGPPLRRLMARAAPRSEAASVGIVQTMAGSTVVRRSLIALVGMAQTAVDFAMPTHQGEVGRGVVELPFRPGLLGVTVGTVDPEPSLVDVVASMAVGAVGWSISVGCAGAVTVAAGDPSMGALQGEVGWLVIERLLVQAHNVGVTAFVLGVAGLARSSRYCRGSSVEAQPSLDVIADLGVTIETERALRRGPEGLVALPTVGLDFRVPADHGAGHDDRLQVDGVSVGERRERDDQGDDQ